jgi:uncharacterized protein (TIRG00374 family)
MLSKNILRFLSSLAIGLFIFWLIMRVVGWGTIIQSFNLFFGFKGLLIFLLSILIVFISGLKLRIIIKDQGYNLTVFDSAKMWLSGFAVSYLTPCALLGGEFFMVYFLKNSFNIPLDKSVASVVIDKVINGTLFFIFIVIGVSLFFLYGNFPDQMINYWVGLIIFSLFFILAVFYFKILRKESFLKWMLRFFGISEDKVKNNHNGQTLLKAERDIIKTFSPKRKIFWEALGLSFLRYFLLLFRASLIVFFLGEGVGIAKNLVIYGVSNLSLVFPLPAALGSLETAGFFVFKNLGLEAAKGTIFAMTWRTADILLCIFGLFFAFRFGLILAEKKILGFIDKLKK